MHSKLAFYAALAAFSNLASAHMKMKTPVPYSADSLDNSPLDLAGSAYPCKHGSDNNYTPPPQPNNMPVGAPQTLSFIGSAVHGGGSCQISLTTDVKPTKKSSFKVIHSIIGGCPSNATDGNLPENAYGSSANNYTFSIPNDVPNGNYALAWTWFNKVGNREMYMNCAPVTVSGSSGNPDAFNKLPDMFIANAGAPSPVLDDTSGSDIIFPNPGQSVDQDAGASGKKQTKPNCPPNTNGCTAPPSGSGSSTSSGSSSSAGAPAAGAAPDMASSAGAQGPSAAPAQQQAAAQQGSSSPSPSPAGGSGAASGSSGSAPAVGAGSAGCSPCQQPGAVVCIGTSQFGICDTNMCAVLQPLAQGTSCKNGVIAKRNIKRNIKRDTTRYNSPLIRPGHNHATRGHHAGI